MSNAIWNILGSETDRDSLFELLTHEEEWFLWEYILELINEEELETADFNFTDWGSFINNIRYF